jgi:hypothetical protein
VHALDAGLLFWASLLGSLVIALIVTGRRFGSM